VVEYLPSKSKDLDLDSNSKHHKNNKKLIVLKSKISAYQKPPVMLGMAVHACNPSYLGGRDGEDQSPMLNTSPSKMFEGPPFQPIEAGSGGVCCQQGSVKRRVSV
jgi:hypothetical protein